MNSRLLLSLLAVMASVGCTVGPEPRTPSPESLGVPARFQSAPLQPGSQTDDIADWWGTFDDPVLTRLVEQALAANLSIDAAGARVRQARAALRSTRAGSWPTLDVGTSATRVMGVGSEARIPDRTTYDAGFDARYELDLFGGQRRAEQASAADLAAVEANLHSTQLTIAAEVALNYVDARLAQRQLAIARANLGSQDETLQIVQWRVQAGLVGALDLEQSRQLRAQTAATVPLREQALSSALNRLSVLTGSAPGTIDASFEPATPIPMAIAADVSIPAEMLRRRPDVTAAEHSLAAETARIGVRQADLYPSLGLSGSLGGNSSNWGDITNASIGSIAAGLTAPIFQGGRLRAAVEQQRAAAIQALAEYRDTVFVALEESENALVAIAVTERRERELVVAEEAARNAAVLARSQYQAGIIDFYNLLDSERSLLTTETSRAAARADRAAASVQLYKALGGGWQNAPAPRSLTSISVKDPMEPQAGISPERSTFDEFLGRQPPSERMRQLRKAAPVVVLLLVAGLVVLYFMGRDDDQPEYATVPVQRGDLRVTVSATGNLQPTNEVEVGSELSGLVTEVNVDNNDRVQRGQVLARIDTARLQDTIAQSHASLQSALANVAQAAATAQLTKASLARFQEVHTLSGGKVPSAAEFDTARAEYARAAAGVRTAEAGVAQARAQLSSDRTQFSKALILSPVTGVVLSRQIDPGQTVAASFNAPVLFLIAEDLSAMRLEVKVDEADVGQVAAGQSATFQVDAFPGRTFPAQVERVDVGANASASSTTASSASSSVVSYTAVLIVDNKDSTLRPGMTATAEIVTSERHDVLLVPNAALRFSPDAGAADRERSGVTKVLMPVPMRGTAGNKTREVRIGRGSAQNVYVLGARGEPQPVAVTTGDSNGTLTEVTGDSLQEGAVVITGQLAAEGASGR